MGLSARLSRQKISTTVAPSTLHYLDRLIQEGKANNLADAIDLVIQRLAHYENQERVEADTAAYFANLTEEEAVEELHLETAISQAAQGIDFNREP